MEHSKQKIFIIHNEASSTELMNLEHKTKNNEHQQTTANQTVGSGVGPPAPSHSFSALLKDTLDR